MDAWKESCYPSAMVTLTIGHVTLDPGEPEHVARLITQGYGVESPHLAEDELAAWRTEVRRRCRALDVPVRTGLTHNRLAAWAVAPGAALAVAELVRLTPERTLTEYGGGRAGGNIHAPDSPEARSTIQRAMSDEIAAAR